MSRVIAIGGGEIADRETFEIDEHIVDTAGSATPRVLFLPTASGEAQGYVDTFEDVYGAELGCETDVLRLFGDEFSPSSAREKIAWADLVYVGGGDTRFMMNAWRASGVADLLVDAFEDGMPMTGLCAGATCWFQGGMDVSEDPNAPYVPVDGFGFVEDLACCPHGNDDEWRAAFEEYLRGRGTVGVALDENCAMEVVDGEYRLVTSEDDARAHLVRDEDGEAVSIELPVEDEFRPLSTLVERTDEMAAR